MVKATFRTVETGYPALMKYDLCGEMYVVLMSEPGVGVVVKSNVERFPIGTYKKDWNMRSYTYNYFVPCTHAIILTNGDK